MEGIGALSVLTARPAISALERRGINAERTLAAARLTREAVSSLDHRLPHKNVRALWEAAAVACRDSSFGVHVAEALPPGAYDLFDYLLATAATVGEALSRLIEHVRLIYDHWTLRLVYEPRSTRIIASVPITAPQYDEFSLTRLLVRTRQASGINWTADGVCLQHERRDDGELARVFGCPVTFGAPQSEIWFRRSVLHLPLASADAALAAILVRYASSLLQTLPPHGTLLARASSAIAQRMTQELPSLGATARSLDLPERTLQRRLSAIGVTYSGLVDEVRRALALKHIGDAGIAITEIAYLLHFADPSAFYRAFKRWTGQSPRRYRARLYDAAPLSRSGR
jgi:AraC-like DNA-binding protein